MAQSLLSIVIVILGCTFGVASASIPIVVDVENENIPTRIAVQTCAGLYNREAGVNSDSQSVYVLNEKHDSEWLSDIEGLSNPKMTPAATFISICVKSPLVTGYIRYDYSSQQLIVPNIITLAGVMDAIPLEDGTQTAGVTMAFDALKTFKGFSALEATQYMYDNHVAQTTTMAFMDPGYVNAKTHPLNPKLGKDPSIGLVDYIVKQRMFNFYLVCACIPLTKEHGLMTKMVEQNPWPRPIAVYGYNDAFPIAGDLFEAETTCVSVHDMGQVASENVSNLSFFSRKPRVTSPMKQNPAPTMKYDKTKTYVAFTMGDGDNMSYVKTTRRDWMKQRVEKCVANPSGCFPLLWSMSPHLLDAAPDMLQWYYDQSYKTGQDYFVLPPSGHLYAYPSKFSDAAQAQFVNQTETDARLMSTSASVTWEFTGSWGKSLSKYLPRYTANGIVKGFFTTNVPYFMPIWEFGRHEFYKKLGDNVVVFKPREWRGEGSTLDPITASNFLSQKSFAAEINNYPAGTVTHVYLTSDGGGDLDTIYGLVGLFGDHVEVVNHEALIDLALQRG